MSTERRIYINNDLDVVMARMQAREMAKQLGFGTADQARISLAASEVARVLAWNLSRPGEIILSVANRNGHHGIQVVCLLDLEQGLTDEASDGVGTNAGRSRSLAGARQLVDESIIEEQDDKYTRVTLIKWLK